MATANLRNNTATATVPPHALVGPEAGPGGFGIWGQGLLAFHLLANDPQQPLGEALFTVAVRGQLSATRFGYVKRHMVLTTCALLKLRACALCGGAHWCNRFKGSGSRAPRLVAQLSPLPSSVNVTVRRGVGNRKKMVHEYSSLVLHE